MKALTRGVLALSLSAGAAVAIPVTAQAYGTGCGPVKSIPDISLSYQNCYRNWSADDHWESYLTFRNNHGAVVDVQSQVDLVIDGFDIFLPVQFWRLGIGPATFDPYNATYTRAVKNSCTDTHTYEVKTRVRLVGGQWGAWSAAPSLYC